jgi:hypothetical protein
VGGILSILDQDMFGFRDLYIIHPQFEINGPLMRVGVAKADWTSDCSDSVIFILFIHNLKWWASDAGERVKLR